MYLLSTRYLSLLFIQLINPLSARRRSAQLTIIPWKMRGTSQLVLFIFQVVELPFISSWKHLHKYYGRSQLSHLKDFLLCCRLLQKLVYYFCKDRVARWRLVRLSVICRKMPGTSQFLFIFQVVKLPLSQAAGNPHNTNGRSKFSYFKDFLACYRLLKLVEYTNFVMVTVQPIGTGSFKGWNWASAWL